MFLKKLLPLNLFIITDKEYLKIEIRAIYDKFCFQHARNIDYITDAVAKSSLPFVENHKGDAEALFSAL